jgi:Flp pilus assembly pilin Flp
MRRLTQITTLMVAREGGATMVEYALMIALIALAAVAAVAALGLTLPGMFSPASDGLA